MSENAPTLIPERPRMVHELVPLYRAVFESLNEPEKALVQLIAAAFMQNDLAKFIGQVLEAQPGWYPNPDHSLLPHNCNVLDVIKIYLDEGRQFDQGFFDRLAVAREGRIREVARIAQQFGITLSNYEDPLKRRF